jgi:hypothetical protein
LETEAAGGIDSGGMGERELRPVPLVAWVGGVKLGVRAPEGVTPRLIGWQEEKKKKKSSDEDFSVS